MFIFNRSTQSSIYYIFDFSEINDDNQFDDDNLNCLDYFKNLQNQEKDMLEKNIKKVSYSV